MKERDALEKARYLSRTRREMYCVVYDPLKPGESDPVGYFACPESDLHGYFSGKQCLYVVHADGAVYDQRDDCIAEALT